MTRSRTEEIRAGLAEVRERIERARHEAGRRDTVDLVVVTKTFPTSDVLILSEVGVIDIGENRDQEGHAKRTACTASHVAAAGGLRWHMIGQVQRNKAHSVAGWADVVESVDRPELATALGAGAVAAGRTLDVLVQVSLDPEFRPGRGGADPTVVPALAAHVVAQPGLRLRGVMGVAPYPGDPSPAFARLAAIADRVRADWPEADRISAGMSGDLEEAIAHGATQVRVGGAVLGPRSYVQ
jgi:pyridoxal phosphate enzyme (YggS family)